MIILGWLVLFVLSGFFWITTLIWLNVSLGFSGKISGELCIPASLALLFTYLTYTNWPFEVALKVVQ